jgi:hypothetical protein
MSKQQSRGEGVDLFIDDVPEKMCCDRAQVDDERKLSRLAGHSRNLWDSGSVTLSG